MGFRVSMNQNTVLAEYTWMVTYVLIVFITAGCLT